MYSIRRQQGMTLIGWVLVLALIAFFTLLGLKIIPIYLDWYKVSSSVESLKNDREAYGKPPRQLREMLMKRLDINMVMDLPRDQIYISKVKNGYEVEVDYIVKEKIAGSISVLAEFNKSVVVPNR